MKVGTWLRRLLPILAIVGLVAGPFTAPVDSAAMAAASSMSMPEMADMPCCPDNGQPAFPDCQTTCPLMAMCAGKSFSAAPTFPGEAFLIRSDVIRPGSDIVGKSLTAEPPSRPPRT